MKIIIDAEPKEIAALVLEIQERQTDIALRPPKNGAIVVLFDSYHTKLQLSDRKILSRYQ